MRQNFVLRALTAAAVAAGLLGVQFSASAGDTKVPEADKIKGKLQKLYNGEVAGNDQAGREKVILEVESYLRKDKAGTALRKPEFWVEAVQEGRFTEKRKIAAIKKLTTAEIDISFRDDKPDAKPHKAKLSWRAGGLVAGSRPAPLLLAVLEKDADPEAYLKTVWPETIDAVGKHWVVAAIAESPEFPVTKDPYLIAQVFRAVGEKFNIDSNLWFLEGVGAACQPVQRAVQMFMSIRLAGLVLRGPQSAVTNKNSVICPTLVLYGATNAPGKATAEAYKTLNEAQNSSVEVPDLPMVTAMNEAVVNWVIQHPKRTIPATSTFVTTITDTDGEPWTGSLHIQTPGKRGHPTTVTVAYLRDTNTVDVKCENLGEFYLYMNDDLLDLDKEVNIFVNGKSIAKPRVFERNLRDMLLLADTFGEYGRMFSAGFRGVVPVTITAPAPPVAPDKPADPTAPEKPADKPTDPPK